MRPDLYERVSDVVANSNEDWFPLLKQHRLRAGCSTPSAAFC
jgi:hypothetical protein